MRLNPDITFWRHVLWAYHINVSYWHPRASRMRTEAELVELELDLDTAWPARKTPYFIDGAE